MNTKNRSLVVEYEYELRDKRVNHGLLAEYDHTNYEQREPRTSASLLVRLLNVEKTKIHTQIARKEA